MKKLIKKMKGKKVLSLVLVAIMLATTFSVAVPMLKLDAEAADITIGDVSQTRVVSDWESIYDNYAAQYLNGASNPTDIVLPGLNITTQDAKDTDPGDYVIQGMAYYPEKDWMLVTAYHNDSESTGVSSKVFALDAKTGKFVAMFDFYDPNTTTLNAEHGGGIAISENNIYYACGDDDRTIAYAPISELNVAEGTYKTIQLRDSVDLYEVGSVNHGDKKKTGYTAYVCYDEGILWTGNFYDPGAKVIGGVNATAVAIDYNAPANKDYNSMVFGYKLAGNSPEEEWDYFKGKFNNLLEVKTASGSSSSNGATFTWNAYKSAGSVNISGTITAPSAYVGEFTGSFGSFTLTEGTKYTIEFTTNIAGNNTDMYMFKKAADGKDGPHCNVKQAPTEVTDLGNGRYRYKMNFTAGTAPSGADSSWPANSTYGYTGEYSIRFDQDAIQPGESREFEITNIKISQTNDYENAQEEVYDAGSANFPSYAIGLENNIKDVQYAVVDNGKLYLSRSYGSGAGNSISYGFGDSSILTIADIDLSTPGTKDVSISTNSENTTFKTIKAYEIAEYDNYKMMPMSEGLCFIDDKIYITFEGASNKYRNEGDAELLGIATGIGNCEKPVDVIWQLDPYKLMEQEVPEKENSIYYQKVNSLSEIVDDEEYIIVHESPEKDPVTQKNILYALNADGGFKDYKLSKSNASTVNGYNAMVGHSITEYSVDGDKLYLDNAEKDDIDNIRWTLKKNSGNNYRIKSTESYFANCTSLYFDEDHITMAPEDTNYLNNIQLTEAQNDNGGFWLSNANNYLWCNDGSSEGYKEIIESYYIKNGGTTAMYSGITEQVGTFHCDGRNNTGSNIIGGSIASDDAYADSVFYIYKRVKDNIASTLESRVYTDLNAELQEDGTYTLNLETYATSPMHYQYVGERPTDYIIVADTSSSMDNGDGTGFVSFPDDLKISSLSEEANTEAPDTAGVVGYGFTNETDKENIYYKHTDGNYYRIYLAINNISIDGINQLYWAYYIANDGLYYVLMSDAEKSKYNNVSVMPGITEAEFKANVDSGSTYSGNSTSKYNNNMLWVTGRRETVIFNSTHYRYDNAVTTRGEISRLSTLKTVATDIVDDIYAQNSQNRIALVQFGGSNGFYNTSGNLSTDDYANAFWGSGSAETLKTKINSLTTSAQTDTSGIELTYANNIIDNSNIDYTADGEKNVAVIFISDGIPGNDTDNSAVTTSANNVITKALNAKKKGAFIYSVLVGAASVSSFSKKDYMDAVSSKYQGAESLAKLGGESENGLNYAINAADCTALDYVNFGAKTTKKVAVNSAVGLDQLDANAIIREQLSNAFKFPAEGKYTITKKLIPGVYDEIGRFSFDEDAAVDATDVEITTDRNTNTMLIKKYNYADEYIAKERPTNGRKLRVTITGLLANHLADITNTSINNTDTTAIYQTAEDMDKSTPEKDLSFKKLPTVYFNIPEYTYVLDYGLQLLDTDVNGTIKSVSADLSAQRDADGNLSYKSVSENGLVAIQSGDQNLLYHTTPTNKTDSGYVLIKRDSGKYDWFEIKVVPASNVYFEETEFEITNKGKAGWSTQTGGTSVTERNLPNEGDVDGYDAAYDNDNTYSNGTTLFTTVDSTNKLSESAKVTFAGNGIDIISACGPTTGMQIIDIKDVKTGKYVAAAVVDTYYADATFSQVPVFSWRGNYGEYIVETSAAYLSSSGALKKSSIKNNLIDTGLVMNSSDDLNTAKVEAMLDAAGVEGIDAENLELVWFDDNSVLNGGSGVAPTKKGARADGTESVTLNNYLDGFRIYNPLGSDSSDYAESEQGAVYYNVIDSLVDGTLSDGSLDFTSGSVAFVTGNLKQGETLSFSNYESIGPKNELYLKGGASTGVAFNTPVATGGRVMVSLRAVNGTATATINGQSFTINSATEMYYDITDLLKVTNNVANVSIINTGSGILAVNNIKLTNAVATSGLLPLEMEDLETVQYYATMKPVKATVENGVVTPVVEEDTSTDNNDTTTDSGENEESFSIFSLIEALIAFIKEILFNTVGGGKLF